MIRFCTYSADNMTVSKQLACESAEKQGAQMVYSFAPQMITHEFIKDNPVITAVRGAGYWLWKPYFVNKAMQNCSDGDILIYGDAGVEFIAPFQYIIDVMDQDIFLFSNGHRHVEWCKMDCMDKMLKEPVSFDQEQVQASVIFFKVNQFTRDFVKEWSLWCQMPGMIDDSPSVLPNIPTFAQHRYDQAILCNLSIKYKIKLHYWADAKWYSSQRFRWPGDNYPLMFNHHRNRNAGSQTGDVEWPS